MEVAVEVVDGRVHGGGGLVDAVGHPRDGGGDHLLQARPPLAQHFSLSDRKILRLSLFMPTYQDQASRSQDSTKDKDGATMLRFLIATLLVEQVSHSLCDESSVIVFTLDDLSVRNDTAATFGLFRTSTSIANCIGSWVTGTCIDRCRKPTVPLLFSMLGTTIGYTSMLMATTTNSFVFLVAAARLFGGTGPIVGRVVADMAANSQQKASVLSLTHTSSALATFLVPPLGALLMDKAFPRAPFLLVACTSGVLLVIFCLHVLCSACGVDEKQPLRDEEVEASKDDTEVAEEAASRETIAHIGRRIVSRECLTFAGQCNNMTMLLVLKDEYEFDVYRCALVMSFLGLACAVTSVASSVALRHLNLERVVRRAPLLMAASCALRLSFLTSLPAFIASIVLDCVSGTFYYPAFDAILLTSLSRDRIGRTMACLDTCGLLVRMASPWIVINIMYATSHTLSYAVGVACACVAWCL